MREIRTVTDVCLEELGPVEAAEEIVGLEEDLALMEEAFVAQVRMMLRLTKENKGLADQRWENHKESRDLDNILCRLETQGRPSQAADTGWHEALAAVRAALKPEEEA